MRKSGIFVISAFVLVFIASANAGLIGVIDLIGDQYPDIMFNNIGTISYSASSNNFALRADDLRIAYDENTFDWLSGPGLLTSMFLDIDVDQSGNLIGTGTMVEKVVQGEVQLGNMTYGPGTILLAGTVYDFGWTPTGSFDFLIDNLSGALVDDEIWPVNVSTGIVAFAENLKGWDGTWNADFDLAKVKGNKAPVPEPTTIALLGLGSLALIRRKRS